MLSNETEVQTLSRRCNEFEARIAALENSEALKPSHNSDYAAALRVIDEYYKNIPPATTVFFLRKWCLQRLHSEEPNVA